MTSVRSRGCPRREYLSVALPDSSPPPGSDDELSDQPAGLPGSPGPPGPNLPIARPSIPKYTEEDLQRILKTVLEARAPTTSEEPQDKPLKAQSPDVYRGKSHMKCYNFCQQCEDYFATAGAKGPNQIPFAASFLRDQISFRWQQYKRKQDADSSVPVTWDEFKPFLRRSLGDSRAFVDSYWGKIKRDSQYQLEEVLDWAAHLEHLQAVLREFDPVAAPNEDILIRYFRKGLRPSIRAQLDARGRELDSWHNADVKTLLQLPSGTREIDAKCLRGYRPAKKEDKDSGKNKSADTPPADVPSGK